MSTASAKPVAKKKRSSRIPLTYVVALVPVAAALNIVGGQINTILKLPIFLDMIGTAVAAIVLGPWWGALVGAITNIVSSFISGPIGLPFAVVNVVGALVWGYGVRWGLGKKYWSYFLLNIIVAFLCSVTAVPIYVFIFGGATGHFADMMTAAFLAMGQNLIVSVFSSNILVSLADKIIAGFVALAIIEALPANLTANIQLPAAAGGLKKVLWIAGGVIVGAAITLIALAVAK
ncbi:ECF transporter S component [Levilinea saccharolytica]|uniref:ECF transporter S component n=1 Tax=Levilinea saccharolytica TaxID=229921 RepID=UPI001364B223|nr:ECF transporter S component [Levilinea saccharolytica]GAP16164.1 putative regulator of cell autolysis [Levilinea saccharolytica]